VSNSPSSSRPPWFLSVLQKACTAPEVFDVMRQSSGDLPLPPLFLLFSLFGGGPFQTKVVQYARRQQGSEIDASHASSPLALLHFYLSPPNVLFIDLPCVLGSRDCRAKWQVILRAGEGRIRRTGRITPPPRFLSLPPPFLSFLLPELILSRLWRWPNKIDSLVGIFASRAAALPLLTLFFSSLSLFLSVCLFFSFADRS